jgi:glycosyltransferase involved in cell wall biosynthesis
MKKIAVILPAYNEELTISQTISNFHSYLPNALFVVVDNNSSDNTQALARKTFSKLKCKYIILKELKRGKGNALKNAFTSIDADIYLIADADMTYPANQAKYLIGPIIDGEADMVVGDRRISGAYIRENKRFFHNFGNNLVNKLVNIFFDSNLNDIMSGFRACSRNFVKTYPLMVNGFQVETDLTLFALDHKFTIKEVPIDYYDRPKGSFSKLNTLGDGSKVIFIIFQTLRYYKPFIFFTILSSLFLILSLISGYPVVNEFINTRVVTHVPLAILSAGLAIISILSFGIGLILDSIRHLSKTIFYYQSINHRNK